MENFTKEVIIFLKDDMEKGKNFQAEGSHKQRHRGKCSDMIEWEVVRDGSDEADWHHQGPTLPFFGVKPFPEGHKEPVSISKQDDN